MKGKRAASLVLSAGFLAICAPIFAHHGSQGYDHTRRVTVKGTVTEFVWANPHSQIYLDAKDDKGNLVHWGLELNSPGNLIREGWTHTSLKAGDEITVSFDPGKEGRPIGICVDIVFSNGQKLRSSQGCVQGNPDLEK